MKRILFFLVFLLILTDVVFAQRNPKITAKELKLDVYFLASDSLKGRKPGTKEADYAATYIRDQFRVSGLKLMCEKGFQYFEIVTDVTAGDHNDLTFENFTGTLKKDFMPLAYSSNGTVSNAVVFAGYGFDIDQDSLKWKDYEGVDVKGKWVMIFRGDPELDNNDSKFIPYTEIRGKILVAKDHGAAGVLVVTPVALDKEDKLIGLHSENNDVTAGIPVINIKREVGNRLLKSSGYRLDSLEKILNKSRMSKTLILPVTVTASSEIIQKKARTENVVGMIEGTDPVLKNEYLLIGGHYDHLGFGGPGSGSRMPDTVAIHNGADDNASGTAMVIELAGKLAADKDKLKRSIIFVAFSGEEMGLLGSKYFTDHSPVDLKKIKAMFNFDMVGRFDKEKNSISVSGTGTSLEGDSIILMYEKKLPFTVTHSPDGYGPSDHASFYASNIPVFYFTTGAHTDYHTPFDDADKLDYDTEKTIGDFSCNIIENVDNLPKALTFHESGKKESAGRSGRRMKVTLGIMPDFAGTEKKGLRVDGVTKDAPADKGGMLKGDIIISINGMPVSNIYEYMTRLGKLNHGQTISVEVIRKGKNEVLLIQL
ncbi:MAG: M20/M25/M40 family metallo-hydrolase [Bacteroidetes bacterium]|nr:M20/M25/M40 family metallo-hydrolase [Bacteroidota bacterium]